MKPKWALSLTEEQSRILQRKIERVPGFTEFIRQHNGDLFALVNEYLSLKKDTLTLGNITMLSMIGDQYMEFASTIFHPDCAWAKWLTDEEIDYLNHFIDIIPGFREYIEKNSQCSNLQELANDYSTMLTAINRNTPLYLEAIDTVKERYAKIMYLHPEALHFVNYCHILDDHRLLDDFRTEATDNFYSVLPANARFSWFIHRYEGMSNPYICSEIAYRLLDYKTELAIPWIRNASKYIFSTPNMYWDNKEAFYGCAMTLKYILDYADVRITHMPSRQAETFVQMLYLLLSRVIYWDDKATRREIFYDDAKMPIQVQHQLQCYQARARLVMKFPSLFKDIITSWEHNVLMAIGDMHSAHQLGLDSKVVGENSVYKKKMRQIYFNNNIATLSISDAIVKGKEYNDKIGYSIYEKYKDGKYNMSPEQLNLFIGNLGDCFKKTYSGGEEIPTNEEFKDSETCSLIRQYLSDNNIHYFYHAAPKDTLYSIIKHGALLSYSECLSRGVVMATDKSRAATRDLDSERELEDYARLSYCKILPITKERIMHGEKLVLLKISTEVAFLKYTMFSDKEATSISFNKGASFDDLRLVDLTLISRGTYEGLDEESLLQYQAEVLVKNRIPLKYIINIDNPELIHIDNE